MIDITGCGPSQAPVAERPVALPHVIFEGSAMRVNDKECESYARECVRLANLVADATLREKLMQMAREWMAVAMHEKKAPESKVSTREAV